MKNGRNLNTFYLQDYAHSLLFFFETYVGEYKHRLRHGYGSYTFSGGACFQYTGDWISGVMHGRGIFLIGDGGSYEGDFVNGEMEGIGLRRWADGSTYNGQFRSGERHGEGVLISSSGEVYEGQWKNNQRDGDGELRYKNGDVFRGKFLRHKAHGQGRIIYAKDRSTYEGSWCENVIVGHGTLRDCNGDLMYEGEWKDGFRHGRGVGILVQGINENNIRYDGIWEFDQPASKNIYCSSMNTSNLNVLVRTTHLILQKAIPRTESSYKIQATQSDFFEFQSLPQTGITLERKHGFCLPSLVVKSMCDTQTGPSQVECESGRLIRLRIFEGPIPTDVDLNDTTSPAQWQFIAALDSDTIQDSMEKTCLTEILVTNKCGLAHVPPLALPDTSLLGIYHLVCDSLALEYAVTSVCMQLTLIE